MNPLINHAIDCLKTAGFDHDIQLLQERYDPQHFGNALVIFRVGRLLVQVIRERGQDFVQLAFPALPEKFHDFDEVDVAMGWKSVEETMTRRGPEPLESVLARLFQHRNDMEVAFSGEQQRFTGARLAAAAKALGDAIVAELQKHKPDPTT